VDAFVGAPDVSDDGQAAGGGVEQDRIVGDDERVIVVAADQALKSGSTSVPSGASVKPGLWAISHR